MQCNCTTANRFSSNYIYADIAQSVVHRIRNPKVASSILAISSIVCKSHLCIFYRGVLALKDILSADKGITALPGILC